MHNVYKKKKNQTHIFFKSENRKHKKKIINLIGHKKRIYKKTTTTKIY